MSWRKSADRSVCSLVAELILIAGNHCLIDRRDHGSRDAWVEYARRIVEKVREGPMSLHA